MKGITCIVAIALFAGIVSCGSGKKSGLPVVDVTRSYPEKALVFQDIAEVEYIPLETTDDFLVQNTPLYIGEEYIIIHEYKLGTILAFDRKTGKAVNRIGRAGSGPGEYTEYLRSLTMDRETGIIYVFDPGNGNKILTYDIDGKFLGEFTTAGNYYYMLDYDGEYLLCADLHTGRGQPFVLVSKKDGSETTEITIPIAERRIFEIVTPNLRLRYPLPSSILRNGKEFILTEFTSDTIYRFNPENRSLTPAILRYPPIDNMEIPYYLYPTGFTGDYIFVNYIKQDAQMTEQGAVSIPGDQLVFDRKSGEVYKQHIVNADYDRGRPYSLSGTNGDFPAGVVVYMLTALELADAYEAGKLSGKLEEIASGLKEDDNPVLMIVKFK